MENNQVFWKIDPTIVKGLKDLQSDDQIQDADFPRYMYQWKIVWNTELKL